MKQAAVLALAALAILGAGTVPAAAWLDGGGAPISRERSPDGQERLELLRPSRWQRLTGHDEGDYAVARLVRASDEAVLGTSEPFVLDGAGSTRWTPRAVEVGVAARFERATGRWRTGD